jgi:hypothetical protein
MLKDILISAAHAGSFQPTFDVKAKIIIYSKGAESSPVICLFCIFHPTLAGQSFCGKFKAATERDSSYLTGCSNSVG